jgi:hypothetical protein
MNWRIAPRDGGSSCLDEGLGLFWPTNTNAAGPRGGGRGELGQPTSATSAMSHSVQAKSTLRRKHNVCLVR